jgi:2-oxoglutarate dehydrogenase E2 component (dihydrolipoamide succinyltransferase)
MAEIRMPQLGESVTEGTITRWFKAVGDHVAEDEVLFEVSTDKVDSEVPSPVSGYLTEIRVAEGETVEVGAVLAVVADSPAGTGTGPPAPEAPAEVTAPGPAPAPAPAPAAPAPAGPGSGSEGGGRLASPLVRRLAAEHGVDLDSVTPTGPGGRITRADVEAAIAAAGGRAGPPERPVAALATPSSPSSAAPEPPTPSQPPAPPPGAGDTVEPLNHIRRRTGEHMVRSKATAPHAYTIVEVDYEGVERVRRRHREEWKATEGFSLTYLPFIARAVVDALREYPRLNASMGEGELIVHHAVNLSIAVDLDFEGLLAPVIHRADEKRLRGIAREINDLAVRARTKKLSVDDITGGTFTLSNSGSFGSHLVLPIINQPQVAIISTDGVSRKPVVVTTSDGTEAIAIHSVGLLAMSWDHRAFDGAYAAAFLREVKTIIETRDWEAEL